MKKSVFLTGYALALAVLLAGSAHAQVSGTSEAQAPDFFSKLSFTTFSEFYGVAVEDPGGANLPDVKGGIDGPSTVYNSFTLGYKISDNVTFGLNPRFSFDYTPEFILMDFRMGPKFKNLIQGKIYTLSSLATQVVLPASEASQAQKMAVGFRSVQDHKFDTGLKGFILSAETEELVKFYSGYSASNGNSLVFEWRTQVGYAFNDKVSTILQPEFITKYAKDQFNTEPVNTKLYLSLDVIPSVNVSPYWKFYPGRFAADNMTIGTELSTTIF